MISYKEAIELAYYGASVIHPKTIKPLQNKNIPLYVKSFIHPSASGTVIQADTSKDAMIPSFIFKKDQVLMSFSPRDFSFIDEGNFVGIFQQLTALGVKVNLMQNTALSFSIVFDKSRINPIIVHDAFAANYEVRFNEDLELVTIRHFDQATIDKTTKNKEILLDQRTRQTIRMVVKSN
jgi:aspartate kinase